MKEIREKLGFRRTTNIIVFLLIIFTILFQTEVLQNFSGHIKPDSFKEYAQKIKR